MASKLKPCMTETRRHTWEHILLEQVGEKIMTFDEWWEAKDERFRATMMREDMRDVWAAATEVEREECAKDCENIAATYFDHAKSPYFKCAEVIRKRSNVKLTG